MCGISGVFSAALNEKDINTVKVMIDEQNLRGPDSNGIFVDKDMNCILGHNRLKIVDLSDSANQPMHYNGLSIVFNGEIYNYLEIKKSLIKEGVNFSTTSDTEVLLKSFAFFGISETLDKINGMFAIALFDKKNKRLHLIRDRLGEKPLYYYQDGDKLYFSSNLKSIFFSLHKIYKRKWSVNRSAIYNFLIGGGFREGESIISGIKKLESGSIFSTNLTLNKKDIRRYWIPKFEKISYDYNFTRSLIEDSIKIREPRDVDSGILFSGGIDSSLIAMFLNNHVGYHFETKETHFAKEIASTFNIEVDMIEYKNESREKYLNLLNQYIKFSGEPSMSCIIPMITIGLAKNAKKVLFTGNGGDELFGGYTRTPYFWKNRLVNSDYQISHIFRNPLSISIPGVKKITFKDLKKDIYNSVDFVPEDFRHKWIEFEFYIKNDLNPTLDYSSMNFSREVRAPFLDHRLVEHALGLPQDSNLKLNKNGEAIDRKLVSKKILFEKLNSSLVDRQKFGFSLPGYISNLISLDIENLNTSFINRGFIKLDESNLKKKRDRRYLKNCIASLELWFRCYIDSNIVSV